MRDRRSFIIRIKKLKDLLNPIIYLLQDVSLAEKMLEENDNQYLRRCYVRAVFAMVEGTIFILKQTVFAYGMSHQEISNTKKLLSISDIVLLQEISIELGNNGKIVHGQEFLRTTDNLRFTVGIISKIFDCNLDLNTGSKNWENFLKSVNIRNRVTHPKSIEDFQISDDEIMIVRESCNWLNDIISVAIDGIVKKLLEFQNIKK